MGNELCVAGGGTPMLVDILVVNNTEIPLNLDRDQDCQRDCHHKGFQIAAGKIVEGREPPDKVREYLPIFFFKTIKANNLSYFPINKTILSFLKQ